MSASDAITEELLWLYELSLSVGQNLDPVATSRDFLRTLLARRDLTGGAVWWLDAQGDGASRLVLLDAHPRVDMSGTVLTPDHPICRLGLGAQPRVLRRGDPEFAALTCTMGADEAVCALYPLDGEGVLMMRSANPEMFGPRMLGQLRGVTAKLATAIQGARAHALLKQSERDLRTSQERLHLAADAARMMMWEVDFTTGRLSYDKTQLPRLGLPAADSPGLLEQWLARVHPEQRQEFAQRVAQAMASDEHPFDYEYRFLESGDAYQWLHTRGRIAKRDPEGRALAALGATLNITQRKQAEAELHQHRQHLEELVQQRTDALLETEARASHILHSSADGLFGVDAEGRITFVNRAARAMLGYKDDQLAGASAHALFHHHLPDGRTYDETLCPLHQALSHGQTRRVDGEVYWTADGRPLPVMYAIHPMRRHGQVTGAVISFVDVSLQRAAAQAREEALAAAEHLARMRSEFLANMSHEIRTPLNGVLGFAQIGQRNADDPIRARNAFSKILSAGQLLLGVINDILDFSKIEAGKLGIEQAPIAPRQVLDHAVELVMERALARQLEVTVEYAPELPERCLGDPLRLGQIVLNLLSNAVKFTERGGITLTAGLEGAWLTLRVSDTGIGMDEEQMGRLFQPFQQADGSTTRRYGGTGLGLAITRRIVDLMGGDIRADSTPGQGSRFVVRLPYRPVEPAPANAVASTQQSAPGKPLAGLSILVVEDVEVNQIILEENLLEDGARVTVVSNGLEAVDRVRGDGPDAYDLVLMDIQMPVMNGLEATPLIHALAPDLLVIGQTAHALTEERDACLAAGMADHISKPIDPEALTALILHHLGRAAPQA